MDSQIKLFGIMRGMFQGMLSDVEDSLLYEAPHGGGNSPAWVLGHLTVCNQFGLNQLGKEELSPEYLECFGPGSKPDFNPEAAPTIAEMKVEFERSADAFAAAVAASSKDQLEASREGQLLADPFATVGDMVGHLLTTHFSLHVGQFSAWRRGRNLPSILKI